MGGSITIGSQKSQGQGYGSKVKGWRTKIPWPCTSNPHGYSTDRLTTLASIPWTQECPQESLGQGRGSKVKGHSTQIPCSSTSTAIVPQMRSTHSFGGEQHTGMNVIDT